MTLRVNIIRVFPVTIYLTQLWRHIDVITTSKPIQLLSNIQKSQLIQMHGILSFRPTTFNALYSRRKQFLMHEYLFIEECILSDQTAREFRIA